MPGGKGSHRKFRHAKATVILSGHDGDDARHYQEKRVAKLSGSQSMKSENKYLKFVLWSDDDQVFVGYAPIFSAPAASVIPTRRKNATESFAISFARKSTIWSGAASLFRLRVRVRCAKRFPPSALIF